MATATSSLTSEASLMSTFSPTTITMATPIMDMITTFLSLHQPPLLGCPHQFLKQTILITRVNYADKIYF